MKLHCLAVFSAGLICAQAHAQKGPTQHDAEFYVLQTHHAQRLDRDDTAGEAFLTKQSSSQQ